MARLAIIVHEGNPGPRELRLGSILEFFGVPWKCADISNPWVVGNSSAEYAVFGPLRLVAAALKEHPWADSKALPPAPTTLASLASKLNHSRGPLEFCLVEQTTRARNRVLHGGYGMYHTGHAN